MRQGKGGKDRVVMLPASLMPGLRAQLAARREVSGQDVKDGQAGVEMADALERKDLGAGASWAWF